jgi:hypothetical protein
MKRDLYCEAPELKAPAARARREVAERERAGVGPATTREKEIDALKIISNGAGDSREDGVTGVFHTEERSNRDQHGCLVYSVTSFLRVDRC